MISIKMPDLESQESAEKRRNKKEQGFKILIIKAGNNSEKLKNETRLIFHSLYRSKKLTKQI